MLVVSRKLGQQILIGDRIIVTVVQLGRGSVRLGIEAPRDCPIVRSEVEQQSGDDLPDARAVARR